MNASASHHRSLPVRALVVLAAFAAILGACDWRGPNPTLAALDAPTGPFAIASFTVPAGSGFGGGTVYYPTDTTPGRYGAVAVAPGFLSPQSSIQWYGPRIASHGFVVITIDTISGFDFPVARADQLLAAVDLLKTHPTTASRVDGNRTAVMGWSMGGGGALEAAVKRPTLKAIVPLAPWDLATFNTVTVPTLIVGCENDSIAPTTSHAEPFYESIPATTDKGYLEIEGGSHSCVTSPNNTIARSVISFLKLNLDGDTRYTPFLCPPPPVGPTINEYRSNCPY